MTKEKKYTSEELYEIYKLIDIETVLDEYDAVVTSRSYPELRMRCMFPWHDDYHASASFNIEAYPSGVYNCSVCGGANFFSLVQKLENFKFFNEAVEFVARKVGYKLDEEYNEFEYARRILERMNSKKEKTRNQEDEDEIEEIFFPSSFKPAVRFPEIIKKRKSLTRWTVENFDLCYCEEGYYKERLIVPVWFEEKLVSFVARDMSGKSDVWNRILKEAKEEGKNKEEIERLRKKYECKKVLKPHGAPIKRIFFNWDEAIKKPEYVILTEGVFDAMKLCEWGYNAIAAFGILINSKKLRMLIDNFECIYIALDNDEGKKKNWGQLAAEKIQEQLAEAIECYNISLPDGKDPDDCTREEFNRCFENSKKKKLISSYLRD